MLSNEHHFNTIAKKNMSTQNLDFVLIRSNFLQPAAACRAIAGAMLGIALCNPSAGGGAMPENISSARVKEQLEELKTQLRTILEEQPSGIFLSHLKRLLSERFHGASVSPSSLKKTLTNKILGDIARIIRLF